jgi:hypothetical protein
MITRIYAIAMVFVVLAALSGAGCTPIYANNRQAFHGDRAEPPSYWPDGWPRIWSE